MATTEAFNLPEHFDIDRELRDQLSSHVGAQRCVEGAGELLLILHDVPRASTVERDGCLFWKRRDRLWVQMSGAGISGLGKLLDRYEDALAEMATRIGNAKVAGDLDEVARLTGPMADACQGLLAALDQSQLLEPDDREIRDARDRAVELARGAVVRRADAALVAANLQSCQIERMARSLDGLRRIVLSLSLALGLFLPMLLVVALIGIYSDLSTPMRVFVWLLLLSGPLTGVLLVWYGGRSKKR